MYFTEAHLVDQNIVFQDNMTAVRMEVNGNHFSSNHPKDINAKSFLFSTNIG